MVKVSELFTDMKNSIIALIEDKTTCELMLEKSKVNELLEKKFEFKNGYHFVVPSIDANVYCWGKNWNGNVVSSIVFFYLILELYIHSATIHTNS
jgi:hypothetical protein